MAYTVGDVSRMARISVRTLHHYDAIGIVKPSSRSDAGYRLYTPRDLERLQQVLFYRELGFPLEEIAQLLADPRLDRRRALMAQRELLAARAVQARALVDLIDKTIAALDQGETMSDTELFDGFDPSSYEEEVKERWGGTREYEESARRTRGYTKDDWNKVTAEAAAVSQAFADLMAAGVPSTDPRAMDAAERHRVHITRWFYACSYEVQMGLGEMYVADPRFAANYEKVRPGLAAYVRDAIKANAARSA